MLSNRRTKWWVLFTACLLTVMLNFDATAVNIAVPIIADDLHANLASMQWVINAFVLVSAMFQIIGGRLGDMHGPRKIYILGTIVFVISSLFAGIAPSEALLILGRVGQGFALGIAYPMTMVLILNAFPKNQQAMAIGFVMGTMGVSLAVGPTLGGVILHYMSWRWIFLINLPIGIFTIICTLIFCSADKPVKIHHHLDYLGGLFLILGLLGIILALNQSQNWGMSSLIFWIVLLLGVISIFILYFVEKNRENRLIDFTLFRIRHFSANCIVRVIAQMIFLPLLFFTPIYLQNILEFDPIQSGLIMLISTFVIGLLSPFAGNIIDKTGDTIPTFFSMVMYAIGCFLLYLLIYASTMQTLNLLVLFAALILIGLATGINFVSTTAGALKGIENERAGMASGVFFTIIWGASALGIAIFGYFVAIFSKIYLYHKIIGLPFTVAEKYMPELVRIGRGLSPPDALQRYFPEAQIHWLNQLTHAAFLSGFCNGFLILAIFSVIGIFIALLSSEKKA